MDGVSDLVLWSVSTLALTHLVVIVSEAADVVSCTRSRDF